MAPEHDRTTALTPAAVGLRLLYGLGWRIGPQLPKPVRQLIMEQGARVAVRRGGENLDHYRDNLRAVLGREPDDQLLRAGVASYLRNWIEVFSLPGWSTARIVGTVSTTGEAELRRALREEGAVVALPHSGNWDLAGAWACVTGMPVTTVVEQLEAPEYAAFKRFREQLGMEIISNHDPAALPRLMTAVRQHRVACLVADRDLLGSGLPVDWAGHRVTMPAGPAVVARRTGASLFPMVCRFTPDGLRLDIGRPIEHRPGRDGLIAMIQDEADYFAERIARTPQDWHLMQPFFTAGTGASGKDRGVPGEDDHGVEGRP
ncbi:phosphatidylinositol mannoside acyltransferase [Microlunatus elymi]|uniref:Phosphatidylinositol mannoside acyltransferase n=1 Tax=Microlunatus elymi TaxID=2596828 RepID=A0A516PZT5_9ACTN|nr:phosphatidylinositol mannoside acyltransferase [Microlunatus elymi]QDP96678.1 phosphatidylinositol mannoside acyltransferase [Microlunatus elymi]